MNDTERAQHLREAQQHIRDAISSIFAAKLTEGKWRVASLDVKNLRHISGNLDEYAEALEWSDVDKKEA